MIAPSKRHQRECWRSRKRRVGSSCCPKVSGDILGQSVCVVRSKWLRSSAGLLSRLRVGRRSFGIGRRSFGLQRVGGPASQAGGSSSPGCRRGGQPGDAGGGIHRRGGLLWARVFESIGCGMPSHAWSGPRPDARLEQPPAMRADTPRAPPRHARGTGLGAPRASAKGMSPLYIPEAADAGSAVVLGVPSRR